MRCFKCSGVHAKAPSAGHERFAPEFLAWKTCNVGSLSVSFLSTCHIGHNIRASHDGADMANIRARAAGAEPGDQN